MRRTGSTLSHVRISPDGGEWLAVFEHPSFGDDRGSVVVIGPGGERTRALRGLGPRWRASRGRPHGSEVWFTGARAGLDATLHAVTLRGAARELVRAPGRLVLHDVARDGRAILDRSTVRFELRGVSPMRRERDLSWLDLSLVTDLSADGRQLVFSESGEGGGPGTPCSSAAPTAPRPCASAKGWRARCRRTASGSPP